ncbi:MAG: hypothetical protein HRU38_21035 [Saccharospirillaceae bacterium]|nr:hypothetical protein [Pseudomonadales bacterium]NRB81117.1 hypothetical protein [Saccharospirillaceae bacterium]
MNKLHYKILLICSLFVFIAPFSISMDLNDFEKEITTSITINDLTTFSNHFDFDSYINTTLSKSQISNKNKADSLITLSSMKKIYLQQLFSNLTTPNSTSKLIKLDEDKIFYRIIYENTEFDFIELIIKKDRNNILKIVDLYLFSTGEFSSSSLANIIDSLFIESNLITKIFKKTSINEHLSKLIQELNIHINNEDYLNAYNIFISLDDKIRSQPIIARLGLHLSSYVSDKAHNKQLNFINTNFKDEQSFYFPLLMYNIKNYEYNASIKILIKINKLIENDAYIHILVAGLFKELGDKEKQLEHIQHAIKLEPDFYLSQHVLIYYLIESHLYSQAIYAIEKASNEHGISYEKTWFLNQSIYEDFINSEEYKNW